MSDFKPHLGIVSIGADNPEALQKFYAAAFRDELWGRNLTRYNTSFSTWISSGVKLSICSRHHMDDKVMFHIIVESLDDTTAAIKQAGGKIVTGPIDIPLAPEALDGFSTNYEKMQLGAKSDVKATMGKSCIYDDPEGNPFGAMQLEPWAYKLFAGSKVGKFEKAESSMGRAISDTFHKNVPARR